MCFFAVCLSFSKVSVQILPIFKIGLLSRTEGSEILSYLQARFCGCWQKTSDSRVKEGLFLTVLRSSMSFMFVSIFLALTSKLQTGDTVA